MGVALASWDSPSFQKIKLKDNLVQGCGVNGNHMEAAGWISTLCRVLFSPCKALWLILD